MKIPRLPPGTLIWWVAGAGAEGRSLGLLQKQPGAYFEKHGFETGWNLRHFAAALTPGQTSPQATKYKETMRD